MNTPNYRSSFNDPRWGDHIPWSLSYSVIAQEGDFRRFFSLLSIRLHDLFQYNEAGIASIPHFGSRLTSESLHQFTYDGNHGLPPQIKTHFSPSTLDIEAAGKRSQDPEEIQLQTFQKGLGLAAFDNPNFKTASAAVSATREARQEGHWRALIPGRLETFQSLLLLLGQLQNNNALRSLVRDIQRFAAESGILLNVKGTPPIVVPIEEPLLEKEVINKLLPRLEAKYPERATDITKAYHDLLKGTDTNTVFGNAFKALEELSREISGNSKLELNDRGAIEKSFPQLHGTIRETILKLTAHRGDEGAHGRKGPDEYEIRYLLFSICNIALLLLDYKEHCCKPIV